MQIDEHYEQELMAALYNLDDSVKSGSDDIPPYFVKRLRILLLKSMLKLPNNSLPRGIFPELWKNSFVFPIFKEGDKNDASNYCPISILSTIANIFESIITKRLTEFFIRFLG